MKMLRIELIAMLRMFVIGGGKNGMIRMLVFGLIVAALSVGFYRLRLAEAAPTPPVIDGSTATFTGPQYWGISNCVYPGLWPDFSTPPITTIVVNNLTYDIIADTPYSAGIYMGFDARSGENGDDKAYTGEDGKDGGSAANLTLTYDGGNYLIVPAEGLDGMVVFSDGGDGGDGGQGSSGIAIVPHGGNGGTGASGGALELSSNGGIQIPSGFGIYLRSLGGNGGDGGDAKAGLVNAYGGDGGSGGVGGAITVDSNSNISSSGVAIMADSIGGAGGQGGTAKTGGKGQGGHAGTGGAGGQVMVTSRGSLTTTADAPGISATSQGGRGGQGGEGDGNKAVGINGNTGGAGGHVTVTSTGSITTKTDGGGIYATGLGGDGGAGGSGNGTASFGAQGGSGGSGGTVDVVNQGVISMQGNNIQEIDYYGIFALSQAGLGGEGGSSKGGGGTAGDGGGGGSGGAVSVNNQADIAAAGNLYQGILAASRGGAGGEGGTSKEGTKSHAGDGGDGGGGNTVNVDSKGNIETSGTGIYAESTGGDGGKGGLGGGTDGQGGNGHIGGAGGHVTVTNTGSITANTDGHGIYALSQGGVGGHGGDGEGVDGIGHNGGNGGFAGSVDITNEGSITVQGNNRNGIYALSQAASGGKGGDGYGVGGKGGDGGVGGTGGTISVENEGGITSSGDESQGIMAASWGGSGGDGGSGEGLVGISGAGKGSGPGGNVGVTNSGVIQTASHTSRGIFAQSVGGFSGSGSSAYGLFAFGADGNSAGDGGEVDVANDGDITTIGVDSEAIFAQSVGGGGGSGGSSGGLFSMGGDGKAGGAGGVVTVSNSGKLKTSNNEAGGIFAQSIGGGGGDGGATINATPLVTVAIGGQAGNGGNGGQVNVTSSNEITTAGINASGIHAQSAGGGGGAGGYAIGATANPLPIVTFDFSLGGSGGDGGDGDQTMVNSSSAITTSGDYAYGIFAESLGGGGGAGGFSVAANASDSTAITIGIGGSGGKGGNAQKVGVTSGGDISTSGLHAHGLLAQSVGGGGGAGGYSATGSLGVTGSVDFSLGGSGDSGGDGGEVVVSTNSGNILTSGKMASGVLAQSVGGGGGAGGFSIAASAGLVAGSISLGGSSGGGGSGSMVGVTNKADISTSGENSHGILAQSVGGGGGVAGYSLSADLGVGALGFSLGGSGEGGGLGNIVTLGNYGDIHTMAAGSHGILAQSVGGGGGAGGWAGTGAMSFGVQAGDVTIPALSLSVALGGKGGPGGSAQKVSVHNYDSGGILTDMAGSYGILAQSIGGGGGDAGWATAAAFNFSAGKTYSANISVAHGGTGGDGGKGGEVEVINEGIIQTSAVKSLGILAQSIGGGGGNGGLSAAITMEVSTPSASTFSTAVSLGGKGGKGGSASAVKVESFESVSTQGDDSTGIHAQSIGGGGGNGGASLTGMLGFSKDPVQLGLSVGGSSEGGGDGSQVTLNSNGNVTTHGDQAVALLAQSLGGGGGNGGISFNGEIAVEEAKSFAVTVGGSGGTGGDGGDVQVSSDGVVSTFGSDSHGIFAQSVGGGGGIGNFAGTGVLGFQESKGFSINLAVNVGGSGGTAGIGSAVHVDNQADISTSGENSYGVFAQSIGGGGGVGGAGFTGQANVKIPESGSSWKLGVSVGGNGGDGNHGGTVQVDSYGNIHTSGYASHGIFAQSIGGGGGEGGAGRNFALILSNPELEPGSISSLVASIGGNGGGTSNGDAVTIFNNGNITTEGEYAKGIFAQSVGGGGGAGGSNKGYSKRTTLIPGTVFVKVGGDAGSSGNGGSVNLTNSGVITTSGEGSHGIQAQSVGGGGGIGGEGALSLLTRSIGIGGAAGAAGDGGDVTVNNSGAINTDGDGAHGIRAQSVGGGGGDAGCVTRFQTEYADIGIGIGWAGDGGGGGDGGKVTITNASDITTRGASAHGIFAQSVGGGGGEAGEVGYGPGAVVNYLLGSVGDEGSGGSVNVSNTANITTLGDNSVGIFAQSAGGEGTGGEVNISAAGDILSSGVNSNGIVAQSLGLEGSSNISISINSGTVQGGVGGSGVVFMDGSANMLTNRGTITTLDGINGSAVESLIGDGGEGVAGNETINNYGVITGSVDLGGGNNAFHNYQGATFNAGSKINLGAGKLFTNDGTISPGGGSNEFTSVLTGDFTQTAAGIFKVTLNEGGGCGQLQVSGTASLDGTLELNYGSGPFVTGATYDILTANSVQGLFSQEVLSSTPLLSFSTDYLPRAVELTVNPESFTTVAQNGHEMILGKFHDSVLASADNDFGRALGEFQILPASGYKSAFASFSPGIYDANTFTTFNVSRQYVRTVRERLRKVWQNKLSQETRHQAFNENIPLLAANDSDSSQDLNTGQDISQQKRWGISIDGFGQFGDADEADGLSGFDYSMGGVAVNVEYALSKQMVVGIGFGFADTQIDLDSNFGSGDIDSFLASVYGTYFIDRAYLEGVFTYGDHRYDNNRRISIGAIQDYTKSDHDADAYSVLIEAGYDFSGYNWAIQPFASLFYTYLDEEGFQESGAGSLDMHIDNRQTDRLTSELGFRVSQSFKTSKGILTPEFNIAWQYDYDVDRYSMPISFTGVPAEINVDGREQSSSALLGAGLSFTSDSGITASLEYNGEIAHKFTTHGVFGQIRIPF